MIQNIKNKLIDKDREINDNKKKINILDLNSPENNSEELNVKKKKIENLKKIVQLKIKNIKKKLEDA